MTKVARFVAWAFSLLLLIGLIYMTFNWYRQEVGVQQTQSGNTLAQVGGDFSLVDQDGNPVTAATYADKPMVIAFGYTFCPDVCPTTLSEMTMWQEALGADADKLYFMFITVDPERDNPETMKYYVNAFFDSLIGLSGTREQIDAVSKAYRVYAKKVEDENDGGNYAMDHTASVFLMKKGNDFMGTISFGEDQESAIGKLRKLIASGT